MTRRFGSDAQALARRGGRVLVVAEDREALGDAFSAPLRPAYLHSATFAGWLRHRASTSLTVPWSAGAVTITTFRLRTAG
ncbi:hypothetical protein ACTMSW_26600, partial [Micromonospora sp. BQ11]|uniref:hypothetical protein n=1 Tax=Micromonospora sp. BQ11 TaxID=3452212 RepID=UPI003F8AE54F